MTLLYHLPNELIFNTSTKEFEGIKFQLSLKYLKLIYQNPESFQNDFISKIKPIAGLRELATTLSVGYSSAEQLKAAEMDKIKNQQIRKKAFCYLKKELSTKQSVEKPKRHLEILSKLKAFLNQHAANEICSIDNIFDSTYGVPPGEAYKINQIKEFILTENKEKIHFEMNNVQKLVVHAPVKYLSCSNSRLKEIELNNELLYLNLEGNQIEEMNLNANLVQLEIPGNNLKELVCNAHLKNLFITNNQLHKITLNNELQVLICNGNELKSLVLNNKLQELYCMQNELHHLELSENLLVLQAQYNPIKSLKLNKKAKTIELSHPENGIVKIDNSANNQKVKIHFYIE